MRIAKKRLIIHYLPIYGCIATGLIYASVGVIAILSFLKLRHGGADESSFIAILNDFIIGKIVIWVILIGTICYIAWRIYETLVDPYGYGKDARGLVKRAGVGLSSVADALIVYAAVRVLLGVSNVQLDGNPDEEQALVKDMLGRTRGNWGVICIGSIISFTAIVQLLYGITGGYRERLDIDHFSRIIKTSVHVLAWIGFTARFIILGITGFFFIKAGIMQNAGLVVNTDKAFDFIGDHVGDVYFIVVAIGTICYGIFMITLGAMYDPDRD